MYYRDHREDLALLSVLQGMEVSPFSEARAIPRFSPHYASPSINLDRTLTRPRTRVDKVNAELVTLTYGTMVAQLCSDFDSNYAEVNKQLDKMGYNIGMRLVEDFFAKSGTQRCANLRETAETISKVCANMPCNCSRDAQLQTRSEAKALVDRIQDLPQYHTHGYELDGRQQTIFVDF